MENGATPPPGMEGATQKQMELFQRQQAAAREQRAKDQDRLLDCISGVPHTCYPLSLPGEDAAACTVAQPLEEMHGRRDSLD